VVIAAYGHPVRGGDNLTDAVNRTVSAGDADQILAAMSQLPDPALTAPSDSLCIACRRRAPAFARLVRTWEFVDGEDPHHAGLLAAVTLGVVVEFAVASFQGSLWSCSN
jgi:hypothetical protein